jgi:PAS domain-containing protein
LVITKQKQSEQTRSTDVQQYLENFVDSLREAVVMLNTDLQVVSANRPSSRRCNYSTGVVGQPLLALSGGHRNAPRMRQWLEELVAHKTTVEAMAIALTLPDGGRKELLCTRTDLSGAASFPG